MTALENDTRRVCESRRRKERAAEMLGLCQLQRRRRRQQKKKGKREKKNTIPTQRGRVQLKTNAAAPTRCRALIEMPPEAAQIVPSAPQHESLADYADERVGSYMASSSSPLIRLQPPCKDPFEQMPRLHNIPKQSMRHE